MRAIGRPSHFGLTVIVSFFALLAAFWFIGGHFGVLEKLGPDKPAAAVSFALLMAPYWALGFGAAEWVRAQLASPALRVAASLLLLLPYLAFAVPRGDFQWTVCIGLAVSILGITGALSVAREMPPGWPDLLVLLAIALLVELHPFDRAWPVAGLSPLAKLVFVDVALYGYLVVRPIPGIGFDLRPIAADFGIGLREFLFFAPIALALGFATGFLQLHRQWPNPLAFAAPWLFTLFFIAIPEELFFRGLLLNIVEKHVGTKRALWITAIVFGLAHFNKRAAYFNWRYVILAAIAGLFYGRAWLARRRVLTSSVTHATVDTVWSIWLR
jgi:membrane protease YdiL (CAAX protease family)